MIDSINYNTGTHNVLWSFCIISFLSYFYKDNSKCGIIPGEPKKSPFLLILQQCMGIFVRNFTRLLSDQIYTLSPSFIEIFLELTKLHSFNHDNPHFMVFVSMFIRMSIQCSLKFEITGRLGRLLPELIADCRHCLLYTSDAADE